MTVIAAVSGHPHHALLTVTRRVVHERDGERWTEDGIHEVQPVAGGVVVDSGDAELGDLGTEYIRRHPDASDAELAAGLGRLGQGRMYTLWALLRPRPGQGFTLDVFDSTGQHEDYSPCGLLITSPVDSDAAQDAMDDFKRTVPPLDLDGHLRAVGTATRRLAELSDAVGDELSIAVMERLPDGRIEASGFDVSAAALTGGA